MKFEKRPEAIFDNRSYLSINVDMTSDLWLEMMYKRMHSIYLFYDSITRYIEILEH